jgi:hypothetical protein
MRTSEANPADWYQLAEDRLRAADAVLAQPGISYAGVELLHETKEPSQRTQPFFRRVKCAEQMLT